MRREALAHGRRDLIALDADQRAGSGSGRANRIDQQHALSVLDNRQQRETKRPAVKHACAVGGLEAPREHRHGSHAESVVAP